ncbi:MAG: DUF4199 domain-containing protein [Bacteroidales bacterium]|nr:DUF4199 domain-containing protein [Bacteroidales bacterium]
MTESNNMESSAWTSAAKDAVFLSLFTIVPQLISTLLTKGGTETGVLQTIVGFLIWVVKFGGSIWFLYRCMKLWAADNDVPVFGQGMKICLFSSIICAAFAYLMYAVLFPGMVETVFAQVTEQLSSTPLPSEAETMLLRMEDNFAMISFVSTLIWCIICGWLFSGIISSSLKRASTPFDGDSQTQDDELL